MIDLDELDAAASARSFSGVVTIDVGDRRVVEHCYGFAHRALRVPNTPGTRFAIASGSKSFTALAIMQQVASGTLALSDPVRRYLGADLPLIDDDVTIEQLLTHTSGIGDYLDEDDDWDPADYVLSVPVHTLETAESFLPILGGLPHKHPPGARFTYCNGGYIVLAIVLERVTGRRFQDVVETDVFRPAGMTSTAYLRSDELPGDVALGYLDSDGDRSNVLHLPVRGNGDGGAYTSAADLHRFWRALHDGAIVPHEVATEMTRPHVIVPEGPRYGLGFWPHPVDPAVVILGSDAGVEFRSTHDPVTCTTATVLSNCSTGSQPVLDLLRASWPDRLTTT
ncbi:serine hydrolase domain-containing protein [Promicromonospora sp. MEB111]|uniref:serine hydrolase domain-containing protein n=1 Tax=Promicromonospora sp. MEB111 TaxID=3040301 RepID=UPI00254FC7DA|nr:serine hydrolase domain-containing protein [Promicromonospora sp. MEB111]